MTTLAPEMGELTMRMSVPFRIQSPMRFIAEGPDFLRGLMKTVEEANTLQQEGRVEEGFALEAWSVMLLAAAIGYDGHIVGPRGERLADFLRHPRTEWTDDELTQLAGQFGIDNAATYLGNRPRADSADDLWEHAYKNVEYHLRPVGLKLAFCAVLIRASEVDLSATRVPEAVSEAARIYRAFASGR